MPQPISPTPMTTNLAELRTHIDALDAEVLVLLNQRAALASQVGEIKRAEGSPVFRPERHYAGHQADA